MSRVTRCALIVRPKQPYVDWANSFDDGGPPFVAEEDEPTVYLAPDFYAFPEMQQWLRENYDTIFEEELGKWMTDEASWPPSRDFVTFERWFDVEYGSMVIDLCDTPPEWDG